MSPKIGKEAEAGNSKKEPGRKRERRGRSRRRMEYRTCTDALKFELSSCPLILKEDIVSRVLEPAEIQ